MNINGVKIPDIKPRLVEFQPKCWDAGRSMMKTCKTTARITGVCVIRSAISLQPQ